MNRRNFIKYLGLGLGGMLASLVGLFGKAEEAIPWGPSPLENIHSWRVDVPAHDLRRIYAATGRVSPLEYPIFVPKHMKEEAEALLQGREVRFAHAFNNAFTAPGFGQSRALFKAQHRSRI